MIDFLAKCLILSSAPITLYISQLSYLTLIGAFILGNPFSIVLFTSALNYLVSIHQSSAPITASTFKSKYKLLLKKSHNNSVQITKGNLKSSQNNYSTTTTKDYNNNRGYNNEETRQQKQTSICCSIKEDKIYIYYKYWLVSTHLTLLIAFHYYNAQSLMISTFELSTLCCSYIILIALVIQLKEHILNSTKRINSFTTNSIIAAMPLTGCDASNDNFSIQLEQSESSILSSNTWLKCNQICYLKMLAHPILVLATNTSQREETIMDSHIENHHHRRRRHESTVTINPTDNRLESCYSSMNSNNSLNDDYDGGSGDMQWIDSKNQKSDWKNLTTMRKILHFNSNSFYNPTSTSYLVVCNLLHSFILAQYAYLNITFCCVSDMSRFGTSLLIPVDCSNIYDDNKARITMFAAVYSAQILLCQITFMCRSIQYNNNNNNTD